MAGGSRSVLTKVVVAGLILLILGGAVASGVLGSKMGGNNNKIEDLNAQVDKLISENAKLRDDLATLRSTCTASSGSNGANSNGGDGEGSNNTVLIGGLVGGALLLGGGFVAWRKGLIFGGAKGEEGEKEEA